MEVDAYDLWNFTWNLIQHAAKRPAVKKFVPKESISSLYLPIWESDYGKSNVIFRVVIIFVWICTQSRTDFWRLYSVIFQTPERFDQSTSVVSHQSSAINHPICVGCNWYNRGDFQTKQEARKGKWKTNKTSPLIIHLYSSTNLLRFLQKNKFTAKFTRTQMGNTSQDQQKHKHPTELLSKEGWSYSGELFRHKTNKPKSTIVKVKQRI